VIYQKINRRNDLRREARDKELLLGGEASRLRKSKREEFPEISRLLYDKLMVGDVLRALDTVDYQHERDLFGIFMNIINSVDDFSAFYDLALSENVPVLQIKFFYRMRREVLTEFFGVILTSFRKIALGEDQLEFRPFQCDTCQAVYCWKNQIFKCSYCGSGIYCSKTCRDKDWTFHRMKCYEYTMKNVMKQQKTDQLKQDKQFKKLKKEEERRRLQRNRMYCNMFLFVCAVFVSLLFLHWMIFPGFYTNRGGVSTEGGTASGRSTIAHPSAVQALLMTWKRMILQRWREWRRSI